MHLRRELPSDLTTQERVDRIMGWYEHDEYWVLDSIAMRVQRDAEKVDARECENSPRS
jgi:hypothetical protein